MPVGQRQARRRTPGRGRDALGRASHPLSSANRSMRGGNRRQPDVEPEEVAALEADERIGVTVERDKWRRVRVGAGGGQVHARDRRGRGKAAAGRAHEGHRHPGTQGDAAHVLAAGVDAQRRLETVEQPFEVAEIVAVARLREGPGPGTEDGGDVPERHVDRARGHREDHTRRLWRHDHVAAPARFLRVPRHRVHVGDARRETVQAQQERDAGGAVVPGWDRELVVALDATDGRPHHGRAVTSGSRRRAVATGLGRPRGRRAPRSARGEQRADGEDDRHDAGGTAVTTARRMHPPTVPVAPRFVPTRVARRARPSQPGRRRCSVSRTTAGRSR